VFGRLDSAAHDYAAAESVRHDLSAGVGHVDDTPRGQAVQHDVGRERPPPIRDVGQVSRRRRGSLAPPHHESALIRAASVAAKDAATNAMLA
jgi:hypothetical protein